MGDDQYKTRNKNAIMYERCPIGEALLYVGYPIEKFTVCGVSNREVYCMWGVQ